MNNFDEKSVFQYFDELFASKQVGKEEESVQNFLMQFAKQNGLNFSIDQLSNVVIKSEEEGEKTTLLVALDFCARKPEKSWFDFNFWSGKLVRNGDYVLSKRAPLCAQSLGSVAIALHALKTSKNVQAVFIFDKSKVSYKLFEPKNLNSSKIIQLVAGQTETTPLSAPFVYRCTAKCSNEKYFLNNSFDLKTFKLTLFENEKLGENFGLKLLAQLYLKIEDAKINKFYSGYIAGNEYKNEIVFTTLMPLLKLQRLIKDFYVENKKLYPTLFLRCTRQINQTLVVSSNQLANFVNNFSQEEQSTLDDQNCIIRLNNVNSNSGFVNFDLYSFNLKTLRSQFESIKNDLKLKNIDCLCYEEMPMLSIKNSTLAKDMQEANPSFSRDISSFDKMSPLGKILLHNKKLEAIMLTFQVENLGLPDEKLKFSSLVNTSLFIENYLKSLENK